MRWAWHNESYSASQEYCKAVALEARHHPGGVIETGSGLTTVVLAAIGVPVVALEHVPGWALRVNRAVRWAKGTRVLQRELVSYGEYDWYDVRPDDLPASATLIVCDGPPGDTRGGRYGLVPTVRPAKGTVILLDDAGRTGERAVLDRWREDEGVTFEIVPVAKPYARVVI
jgi:hypothetical protein